MANKSMGEIISTPRREKGMTQKEHTDMLNITDKAVSNWYEIFIFIAILLGSTVGVGILSAKIYRVGVLLYGTPPKFSTIMKTVFKKQ